jgi:membrane-associated protease RseP (regulator of RpoE activity)
LTYVRDGVEETVSVVLGKRAVHEHHGRWGVVVDRQQAFLGVHVQELNDQLAEYFEVDAGLLILDVIEEGPAEAAGLQAGDVLLEIDGKGIPDRRTLHQAMAGVEPGDAVAVQIQRRGRLMTLDVLSGEREEMHGMLEMLEHHGCLEDPEACHTKDGNVEIVFPRGVLDELHEHAVDNDD